MYVLVATNVFGCSATLPLTPTPTLFPYTTLFRSAPMLNCIASSVQLHALSTDTGLLFLWTGPGIVGTQFGSNATVLASDAYTVVATNIFGCTATASVVVNQNLTTPNIFCGSAPVL